MSRSPRVKVGGQNFLALLYRSDSVYDQLLFLFTPGIDRVERARTAMVHPRNVREHPNAPHTSSDPVRLGDRECHLRIVVGIALREVWRKPHVTEIEERHAFALGQSWQEFSH